MGRLACAIFAGFLILPLLVFAQKQPDFSGIWKMDPSRSESAHQAVPIGPVEIVIQQTVADFRLETRSSESNSSKISTETLTFRLDGSETTETGASGIEVKVKAHWAGRNLVAETAREINGSTVTTMETFQLQPGAKEIKLSRTLTVQHGYQSPGAPKTTGSGTDLFVKATDTTK